MLAINKRVQTQNNAPLGFPNFVRDGYEIVILADGYQETQDGLIWKVRHPDSEAPKHSFFMPASFIYTLWIDMQLLSM